MPSEWSRSAVVENIVDAMNQSGIEFSDDVSEFKETGPTAEMAHLVRSPTCLTSSA